MNKGLKIKDFFKNNGWIKALIGMIVTAIITANIDKACDRVAPDEPIVIKEVKDTIRIIHNYDFDEYNDSIVNSQLRKKLENIELAQTYEQKIESKIKDPTYCNSIMIGNEFKNAKGYIQGNAAPYFIVDMSSLNNEYIDFELHFFDTRILSNIYCLNLEILRIDNGRRTVVLNENYYVTEKENRIRVANSLSQGLYEFSVGFVFNNDKDSVYPTIYQIIKQQRK